ncbi:transglycosylase family protein [Streptomyces sp. CC208A]|uniref:LysM peptidoglycan-binding domain-containing protein n=1 Tax=Streptomyces sp. CC208A TaxID=3044573 RepID=UPI0024A9170E|nr:transglycosylase family protein [Streptomyces sp. CC208A]
MLSGNGRHRRPRQAPAIVVTAGVTGSAMALPLLAAGSASAADAATWDRVAACESGGQWSAHFGNGMYGGLQMTQEAWERHGGLAYAPSPDLASRAQQITVADKALAAGSTDWATCAPIAGLKNDGVAPGVQPGPAVQQEDEGGVAPESDRTSGTSASTGAGAPEAAEETRATPSAPSASAVTERAEKEERVTGGAATTTAPATPTTPAAPTTPAPTGTVTPGAPSTPDTTPGTPGTPDASTGTPDASTGTPVSPVAPTTPVTPGTDGSDVTSATPGTGKHRGEAAPEESGVTDSSKETGRHAAAEGKVASTPAKADGSGAYTVRPGDSLSEIAQENDLPGGWDALYDANRQTVGADPDLILPGQSLELTATPTEK